MKKKITLYGEVKAGKLKLKNRPLFEQYLSEYLNGEVKLTLERVSNRPKASHDQHEYYRGYVVPPIAENLGYDTIECHKALMTKHYYDPMDLLGTIPSTADFSTTEFIDHIDFSRNFASQELGIYIPLPDEFGFHFFLPSQKK